MKKIFIIGFNILTVLLLIGCGTSNPNAATIDGETITLKDFEDAYTRKVGSWDSCANSSIEERQKFLDSIIKMKLKVKDARAKGFEKDSTVISDINTFRVPIVQNYLLEKEIYEPGINWMYDWIKEKICVAHISFSIAPNAAPADTLKAYERAMKAIEQIESCPMDSIAQQWSEDKSVEFYNGDQNFLEISQMLPEYENACCSLKQGEYTKIPIRTIWGYYVIKVTSRQPNQGSIRFSHVLLGFNKLLSDTAAVRDSIWMLYRRLKHGEDFAKIALKYSYDPFTDRDGGDVGFVEHNQFLPMLADILSKLPINTISEPVRFDYGYHIFKVTDKIPMKTVIEMKDSLMDVYRRVRYNYDYKNYMNSLKVKHRLVVDTIAVNRLARSLDTTKTSGFEDWSDMLKEDMLEMPLVQTAEGKFTVRYFVEKIKGATEFNAYLLTRENVWSIFNSIVDIVVFEIEAKNALERHPALAKLMHEYEEKILMLRVEQDEVWKKYIVNDSLLRAYYEGHKEMYCWPNRVNFAEIYVLKDSVAKAVYKRLKLGEDFLSIAENLTIRLGYKEKKGVWGFQPFTLNDLTLKASTMAVDSITLPFKHEIGWSIIKALGKDNARVKTFEEAKQEVAADYQSAVYKQHDDEWIEALKLKYSVTINKDVLVGAFKREQ